MAVQMITAEVRSWISAQLQEGYTPEQLKAAMRASGWVSDVAEQAVLEVTSGQTLPPVPAIAASGSLPEPDLSGGHTQLEIDGHHDAAIVHFRAAHRLATGGPGRMAGDATKRRRGTRTEPLGHALEGMRR